MNRINHLHQHLARSTPVASTTPSFTREDILRKREEGQVWIVIKNNVYNVTEFLDEHPGGAELITDIPAEDFKTMTREFDDAEHSEEAMEQLQTLFVGTLATEIKPNIGGGTENEDVATEEEDEEDEPHQPNVAFDPARPFEGPTNMTLALLAKEDLSHDVTVYRFALPRYTDEFSLMIGKHIMLSYEEMDGKHVSRAYTPVSPFGDGGFVDFLIKHYPTGKMSQHLRQLRPMHDSIQMKGPKGKLGYLGNGIFSIRRKGRIEKTQLNHIGMIAGGSGITPMFQIIQAVARNPNDELKITLIFANKTVDDICLQHPLNEFMRLRKGQINVVYTLDAPPDAGWSGEKGFVTEAMIKKHLPAPSPSSMIFLCGPPPMIKKACQPALKALGYPSDSVFKF